MRSESVLEPEAASEMVVDRVDDAIVSVSVCEPVSPCDNEVVTSRDSHGEFVGNDDSLVPEISCDSVDDEEETATVACEMACEGWGSDTVD